MPIERDTISKEYEGEERMYYQVVAEDLDGGTRVYLGNANFLAYVSGLNPEEICSIIMDSGFSPMLDVGLERFDRSAAVVEDESGIWIGGPDKEPLKEFSRNLSLDLRSRSSSGGF
ncbi:MAG: hypothetical protein HYU48_01280 [Candidatus Levybacteria bacterium]|nr:hypothetical protein [Candidatus Levybacteria bacterium]